MRIVIHDYAGHPFQFDLSRNLSKEGNEIFHIYTKSSGGPKAGFDSTKYKNLKVISIDQQDVKKNNFFIRFFQELTYGKKLVAECEKIKPDIIISANTPIPSQYQLWKFSKKSKIKFIFWLQDIISIAASSILSKRIGVLGSFISSIIQYFEKKILKESSHVITIAEDFNDILKKWNIKEEKISTIPNWAPIEEMPLVFKENEFSRKFGIIDSFNVIYSGTLGFKHNPDLILDLADALVDKNIKVIVISEGEGMEHLKNENSRKMRPNLLLLPFQPYPLLPKVLGSADVLLTLLEPEAGIFSVPSKVWSGFCAGKASLLYVPENNLSSKITTNINAGINSKSIEELISAVIRLYKSPELCKQMGNNARMYAESNFLIDNIAKKFMKIFQKVNNEF